MAYKFNKSGKLSSISEEELETTDDDGSFIILLDHITSPEGKACWIYIAVKTCKYKEFRQRVAQRATVKFKDYGKILRYGYDSQIPEQIKLEMKEKFGLTDEYMQWLKQDAEKERQIFLKEKEEKENVRLNDIVAMLKKQQE